MTLEQRKLLEEFARHLVEDGIPDVAAAIRAALLELPDPKVVAERKAASDREREAKKTPRMRAIDLMFLALDRLVATADQVKEGEASVDTIPLRAQDVHIAINQFVGSYFKSWAGKSMS
jgi:hypothetical protein